MPLQCDYHEEGQPNQCVAEATHSGFVPGAADGLVGVCEKHAGVAATQGDLDFVMLITANDVAHLEARNAKLALREAQA